MTNLPQIFGITSGVLTLVGLLWYAKSIVKGHTKPERVTWFLRTLNSLLLLTSYDASGADATVWLAAGYAAGLFIVWLLSIKYGIGGWRWTDQVCLVGAAIGLFLWWYTGEPLTALVSSLLIDLFGVTPTIIKSWTNPEEEDKTSWVILLIAGFFSILAIEEWTFFIYIYPFQITITTILIVSFLFYQSRKSA